MQKKNVILQENFIESKEKLIKDFLNYIDVSKKTQETYQNGLDCFYKYICINKIKNPTREDIMAFKNYIKNYLSVSTVNTYLIGLRNFFKWLEYIGAYKNVADNIKNLKLGNTHRKESLTQEQCKQLLTNVKNCKEKAILLLAITCGLRANELVNIRLEDFKIKDNTICLYVLGKNRDFKEDFVVVPEKLYNYIQEYIREYNITDYLFVSDSNHNKNGKLTTKTIRLIVKNMFKRIGIDGDEYSLHSCRHYFATNSIKNGVDIREVSQALRHKSLSTTTIYLHDLEMLNNTCSNKVYNSLFNEVV